MFLNITLYWLTNTAISLACSYWAKYRQIRRWLLLYVKEGVKLPVGVSAFAEEIYQVPKSWSEKAYVSFIHQQSEGTHFAAWEETGDLRLRCVQHSNHCEQPATGG